MKILLFRIILFLLLLRLPPRPTLFPYTTLFRSPPSPGMGYEAALAYDPRARLVIRWAGHNQGGDRKSTRLNSSHVKISYAVFCLKKKIKLESIAVLQK